MSVLAKQRYNWDGMQIDETRMFAWVSRTSAATSFASYAKVRSLNWECSTKSEPSTPERGKPCRTVWVTRINPRKEASGISIPEADNPAVPERADPKRPAPFVPIDGKQRRKPLWVLDLKEVPAAQRKAIYESRSERVRLSRQGWDRMHLDEWKIVRTPRQDIRDQIVLSCIPRGLLWRFHILRVACPEAEASGPYVDDVWYGVLRIG